VFVNILGDRLLSLPAVFIISGKFYIMTSIYKQSYEFYQFYDFCKQIDKLSLENTDTVGCRNMYNINFNETNNDLQYIFLMLFCC